MVRFCRFINRNEIDYNLIVNFDETRIQPAVKARKVVTLKNDNNPYFISSQNRWSCTMGIMISAGGKLLEPLFILPSKTLPVLPELLLHDCWFGGTHKGSLRITSQRWLSYSIKMGERKKK